MVIEMAKVTKEDVLRFIDDTIEEIESGTLTLGLVGGRLLGLKDSVSIIKTIRYRVALMESQESD